MSKREPNKTAITGQKGGNGEDDKPPTPQEMLFVQTYVRNGGNGVQAYGQAGYSTKASDGGASSASALLRRPRVARAIQAALAEAGYSPDGIRSKLMVYATNDPRDFEPWFMGEKTLQELSADGVDTTTIQEVLVTIKPTKSGDQITRKLRFCDPQQAVTTAGKMLGLLDERKRVEVSGMVGVGALDLRDKSDEELQAIRHAMTSDQPPPKPIEADPQEVTKVIGSEVGRELIDEITTEDT